MNLYKSFFIYCSGSDTTILSECSQGTNNKRVAFGLLVFISGLLAFASGSYFFKISFFSGNDSIQTDVLSVLLGFIWAFIIFHINRYLIMTYEKRSSDKDEHILTKINSAIFKLLSLLMRILLACIIAYLVSHSLLLKVFDASITEYLNEKKKQNVSSFQSTLVHELESINVFKNKILAQEEEIYSDYRREVSLIESNIGTALIAYQNLIKQWREKSKARACEADGTCGSEKKSLENKIGRKESELKQEAEYLRSEANDAKQRHTKLTESKSSDLSNAEQRRTTSLNNLQEQRKSLSTLESAYREKIEKAQDDFAMDFLARSNAVDALAQENRNVFEWKWILTVLVIILDLIGLFAKLLPQKDEYDQKLEFEFISVEQNLEQKKSAIKTMYNEFQNAHKDEERFKLARAEVDNMFSRFDDLNDKIIEHTKKKINQQKVFNKQVLNSELKDNLKDDFFSLQKGMHIELYSKLRGLFRGSSSQKKSSTN